MGEWVLGWVSAAGAYHVREALRVTDADTPIGIFRRIRFIALPPIRMSFGR